MLTRSLALAPRQVTVLAFPGVEALDVTGSVEVFANANRLAGRARREA